MNFSPGNHQNHTVAIHLAHKDRTGRCRLVLGLLWALSACLLMGSALAYADIAIDHEFTRPGSRPMAPLAVGPDGAHYGTTHDGGVHGYGTIFRIEADGVIKTLHHFDGAHLGRPYTALTLGNDGAMYGWTDGQYDMGPGGVFRITPEGDYSIMHTFGSSESWPVCSLTRGSDDALYGVLVWGGPDHYGSIYRIAPDGTYSTVHVFDGRDGEGPFEQHPGVCQQGLTLGPDGALYGTTTFGGTHDQGTIFRLGPDLRFTSLHSFAGTGGRPYGSLTPGNDGALYGTGVDTNLFTDVTQ